MDHSSLHAEAAAPAQATALPGLAAGGADLIAQFERQGYLHVRGLLREGAVRRIGQMMYGELESLGAQFMAATGARLDHPEDMHRLLHGREGGEAWFEALPRDLQHLIRGEFPLDVRLRAEVLLLTRERRLTALLQQLLGDTVLRLHYPPMLRFKIPAMDSAWVPLHQDAPYFPHLADFLNVWVPLCGIDEQCGGVNVLEGSHRLGPLPHQEAVLWGKYLERRQVGEGFVDRHIEMEPGDVLIFGPNLVHYTHANTSRRIRCSIDSRWFSGKTATTRQYYDLERQQVVRMF